MCGRTIWRFWYWIVHERNEEMLTDDIWCAECHSQFRESFKDKDEIIIFDERLKNPGNDHPEKDKIEDFEVILENQ